MLDGISNIAAVALPGQKIRSYESSHTSEVSERSDRWLRPIKNRAKHIVEYNGFHLRSSWSKY